MQCRSFFGLARYKHLYCITTATDAYFVPWSKQLFFWRERDSVFESFGALFTLFPAVISPLFLLWKVNLPFSPPLSPSPVQKEKAA